MITTIFIKLRDFKKLLRISLRSICFEDPIPSFDSQPMLIYLDSLEKVGNFISYSFQYSTSQVYWSFNVPTNLTNW